MDSLKRVLRRRGGWSGEMDQTVGALPSSSWRSGKKAILPVRTRCVLQLWWECLPRGLSLFGGISLGSKEEKLGILLFDGAD